MSIGLGIGVSHAPSLYAHSEEQWDALWHRMSLSRNVPQPASVAEEKGDKLREIMDRLEQGHKELIRVFNEYSPELLIIIGGDQTEMFDRSNVPQIMIYETDHTWGRKPMGGYSSDFPDAPRMEMDVDREFSRWLLNKLVKQEGFDVAFSSQMHNLGGRGDGIPHAFAIPASYLLPNNNVPVVLIYENTYDPPSLSATRCYELGRAIARLVKNDSRRIAILGSGGLSHDPGGKRSGWIDQPLDHWFLDQLREGNARNTEAMFRFDSDAMVAGTGEMRSWITVAGAMEEMGATANVIDYVPAGKSVTGAGFAYWLANEAATPA